MPENFVAVIVFDRNPQVCWYNIMLRKGKRKTTVHGTVHA